MNISALHSTIEAVINGPEDGSVEMIWTQDLTPIRTGHSDTMRVDDVQKRHRERHIGTARCRRSAADVERQHLTRS